MKVVNLGKYGRLLIAVGVLGRLALAWLPFESWQVPFGPLTDDSFYYFGIARNLAAGSGFTFDGVTLTSGFQVLWALLLVPIWWVIPSANAVLPIHVALSLLTVIHGLSSLAIWRLASGLGGRRGGLFALGLWTFSPYVVDHGLNGMETGLATCLLLWTLERYLFFIRQRNDLVAGGLLGLLAGLCWLARVDSAVLVMALAADYLFRFRSRSIRPLLMATAVGAAVVSPWVTWCLVIGGSILPESGAAVRVLSELYCERAIFSDFAYGSLGFYGDNLTRLAREVVSQPLIPIPVIPIGYVLHQVMDPGRFHAIPLMLTFGIYGVFGALAWRLGLVSRKAFSVLPWLWVIGLLAAYALRVPGHWFYGRYVFSILAVGCVLSGIVMDRLGHHLPSRFFRLWLIMTTLSVGLTFVFQARDMFWRTDGKNIDRHMRLAQALPSRSDLPQTLGVFQAGTIGYFSDVSFVALDGKVDREARIAIERRQFHEFLWSRQIQLVVDPFPWTLGLLDNEGSARGSRHQRRFETLGSSDLPIGYALILADSPEMKTPAGPP